MPLGRSEGSVWMALSTWVLCLSLNAEFRSGGFGGGGLFHLIVVVLGNQRYQET